MKKTLCILLALLLIIGAMPAAFAVGETAEATEATETTETTETAKATETTETVQAVTAPADAAAAENAENAEPAAETVNAVSVKSVTAAVMIAAAGKPVVAAETVTASDADGDGKVNLDELLYAAHELYYTGGAAEGYASYQGGYGLSLGKLWGDESGSFGYYINGTSAYNLSAEVKDGDYAVAFVYADTENWGDTYAQFDVLRGFRSESITLTLSYAGWDESWAQFTAPLAGAEITLDGERTGIMTDVDGRATVSLVSAGAGRHIISAVREGMTLVPPVCVVTVPTVAAEYSASARRLLGAEKEVGTGYLGGEWLVIGLVRGGADVPETYYKDYYAALEERVSSCDGILSKSKNTEYSRTVLAVTALGLDARDVAGYDLTRPLGDYKTTVKQGLSGAVWALIALDCGDYPVPVSSEASVQATRELYIRYILDRQLEGGGWSIGGSSADPDVTGMVIAALANYRGNAEVDNAVNSALERMSAMQNSDGSFTSWGETTAETCCQMLIGLSALGIGADDARFVKNGHSILDALRALRTADGGYLHRAGETEAGEMASEQALYALAAVERCESGMSALYDMSDAEAVISFGEKPKKLTAGAEVIFSDTADSTEAEAITALAALGVVNGMGDDSFAPEQSLTRAQFAAIVVRSLGLDTDKAPEFSDVPASAWYAGYIGAAASSGIVRGVGDGKFDPEGTITREAAMTMLCRAARICGLETGAYGDEKLAGISGGESISAWARKSIAFCLGEDIFRFEGELKPTAAMTRGEMAGAIYRLLQAAGLAD